MELIYINTFALALAYTLDLAIGDPQNWPTGADHRQSHPSGNNLRQHFHGAKAEGFAGAAIVILVAGGSSFWYGLS